MESFSNIGGIIALISFVVLLVLVWRSGASTVAKVAWSVAGFFFSLITLIVWLVWGQKKFAGSRA